MIPSGRARRSASASTAARRATRWASTLLAEVRADQALAAPIAREVALACDGPDAAYSRHGFSFTLPVDHSGNVFVYAIDQATEDGPAAPPTLIRNGVVPVAALRAQ